MVVASAPGKRFDGDTKVTDLLYRCYDAACAGQEFAPVLDEIRQRFADIIGALRLSAIWSRTLPPLRRTCARVPSAITWPAGANISIPNYWPRILASALSTRRRWSWFRADGSFDPDATNTAIGHTLVSIERAVIPGFYGAMPDGTVHTFSRGGSDVTGSVVARAVGAGLYENWTDVSGVLSADPRIIEHPHVIDYITYRELRELSYMGASVLHEDAVFPVRGRTSPSTSATPTARPTPARSSSPRCRPTRTSAS